MSGNDILLTLAQISLGLAGFTGIVVAFRQRGVGSWPEFEQVRFKYMLELAVYSILFELLPFLVFNLGVNERLTWAICSGLLALWLIWRVVQTVRIAAPVKIRLNKYWFRVYQWGSGITAVTLCVNMFSALGPPQLGLYLVGLGWMLFYSASLYVRLVLMPISTDEVDPSQV